jgi:hypothetical protein
MLHPIAFASSVAILSGALYLGLYALAVVWRDAFRLVFNAQFLGADVASLLPRDLPARHRVSRDAARTCRQRMDPQVLLGLALQPPRSRADARVETAVSGRRAE